MKHLRLATAASFLSLAMVAVGSQRTSAQQAGRSKAVVIAIVDNFPSTAAKGVVMRSATGRQNDIIVLSEGTATPEALGGAISILRHLRAKTPVLQHDQVASLTGAVPKHPLKPQALAALKATLAKLRNQPSSRVGNLGRGRWIQLANATPTQ